MLFYILFNLFLTHSHGNNLAWDMLVKTLDDNNIKLTKDVKSAGIAKRALKYS